MEKTKLVFKLAELRQVTNKKGEEAIMVKLFCESYLKSVTKLGDFKQSNMGQLTYYMFIKELPKHSNGKPKYKLGEQDGSVTEEIEHYYEGAGIWKPTEYNVVEKKVKLDEGEVRIKQLKAL